MSVASWSRLQAAERPVEFAEHLHPQYTTVRTGVVALVLALAITIYGGILRLNVITSRYGTVSHPTWARILTTDIAPLARQMEPRHYRWPPVAQPYVGGDPINYLRFGREMRSFYQGHVREPVFLAITRLFLYLLDNQEIAVSFASAAASTLCIFATYLLGRAAFGVPVGLLAALGFAIDYDAVSWAADGWRDDTFACVVALGAWGFVRLREAPRLRTALLAGTCAAAACLTRITAVSWILPGLLVIGLERRADWRDRLRAVGAAAIVTIALVAPYLFNTWRATGDPFYAINAHTDYYRASERIDTTNRMSAVAYIRSKLTRKPVYQADTAITGLFVYPMRNKWSGFDLWIPRLSRIAMTLSILGLIIFLWSPNGRLLLVITLTSLIPYAFTWNVGGGGEWRFTMHAYPFFLIAAALATVSIARALRHLPLMLRTARATYRPRTGLAVVAGVIGVALLCLGYLSLPYFVVREALAYGESTSIEVGERDWLFYTKGWSGAKRDGAVTSRVIVGDRATIRIPIPSVQPYRLTVRADPVTPQAPRRMVLLLNDRVLFPFGLGWDPNRVGSYSVDVAPDFLHRGANELKLVADSVVPARQAGRRYAWLAADTPISLRVWYVRLIPMP